MSSEMIIVIYSIFLALAAAAIFYIVHFTNKKDNENAQKQREKYALDWLATMHDALDEFLGNPDALFLLETEPNGDRAVVFTSQFHGTQAYYQTRLIRRQSGVELQIETEWSSANRLTVHLASGKVTVTGVLGGTVEVATEEITESVGKIVMLINKKLGAKSKLFKNK